MSERVFERASHHGGAFFVAGFAATRSSALGGRASVEDVEQREVASMSERVFERANHGHGAPSSPALRRRAHRRSAGAHRSKMSNSERLRQ